MKTAHIFHIVFLGGLFVSLVSFAKDSAKETVVYEKSTKIDFSDREVDGDFMNPDGRSVSGEKNLYFDSLFEDRKNFRKELKRSSEAVR